MTKVAVIGPTASYCFREMLRGIGTFAKAKATWRMFYFLPNDNILSFLRQEKPDGLLFGAIDEPLLLEAAAIVDFSVGFCNPGARSQGNEVSGVVLDDKRVGAIAAEYFIKKQYTNFSFIGHGEDQDWSMDRQSGFESELAIHGYKPDIFHPAWESTTEGRGWRAPYPNNQLVPYITSLPKPVAILACNDLRGREIVEACKTANIRIPEDVAVLGVDNDHLDCDLCSPGLSSIAVPWHQMGFLSAKKLESLIEQQSEHDKSYVEPTGIVERQSTDSIAISDSDVASALRYIREHAHLAFNVDDLIDSVSTGRRTLEKKFRGLLGRSLHDEIRRVHLDRAKYLLAHTEMSISDVAEQSGYTNYSWFCTSFHENMGISPAGYRKSFRQ